MDALRKAFPQLDALGWLRGTIRVNPVVETLERENPFSHSSNAQWPRFRYFDCKAYLVVSRDDVEDVTGVPGVPLDLRQSLQRFRGDFPNPDKAAFLIMRFGSTPAHRQIVDAVRRALEASARRGGHSRGRQDVRDDILGNIRTYMHGCAFGIAVFERNQQETFNPNVSFEVGYLMALGKPVCLLKDKNLNTLHANLIGGVPIIPFNPFEPQASIASQLGSWLRDKSPSAAIAKSP